MQVILGSERLVRHSEATPKSGHWSELAILFGACEDEDGLVPTQAVALICLY